MFWGAQQQQCSGFPLNLCSRVALEILRRLYVEMGNKLQSDACKFRHDPLAKEFIVYMGTFIPPQKKIRVGYKVGCKLK